MAEHITAGEFQRFAERLFSQLDSIERKQDLTNGRVTQLETEQKITKRIAAYISAAIGLVIAVGGFILQLIKW
jgi:tetrahydromethanopterin S-methyltransferase subunit G